MSNEKKERAVVQPRLKIWLRESMKKRGWGIREVSRRGEIAHSSVGRAINDDETIGFEVVRGLHRAFGQPLDTLLEMAELLPAKPPETTETRTLVSIYRNLDDADKRDLMRYAEWLRDR